MYKPKIQKMKLSALNPAAYNPRTISPDAMAGLSKSLERFGCVEPIIVNVRDKKNVIVGGHQRHAILTSKGVAEMDCVVVDLSEKDERLLNLSLNNPQTQGQFIEGLAAYIKQLKADLITEQDAIDFKINELYASLGEMEMPSEGKTDPDAVPEPPKVAVTKPGDLYLMGGSVNCPKCGKVHNI